MLQVPGQSKAKAHNFMKLNGQTDAKNKVTFHEDSSKESQIPDSPSFFGNYTFKPQHEFSKKSGSFAEEVETPHIRTLNESNKDHFDSPFGSFNAKNFSNTNNTAQFGAFTSQGNDFFLNPQNTMEEMRGTFEPKQKSGLHAEDRSSPSMKSTQEPKLTLKDYLETKNLQRNLEYRTLNQAQNVPIPIPDERQEEFLRQMHDIKGFLKHILGEGSLCKRVFLMVDNLYEMFMKQIRVYHHIKFEREKREDDQRFNDFKAANIKLEQYLEQCKLDADKTSQKLEALKKNKEFFKKERENNLYLKEKMKKSKLQEQEMMKDTEPAVKSNTINLNTLLQVEDREEKSKEMMKNSRSRGLNIFQSFMDD